MLKLQNQYKKVVVLMLILLKLEEEELLINQCLDLDDGN